MVDDSYALATDPPPSAARRWFNQVAMPAAIQAAGSLEAVAERVGQATRRNPGRSMAIAAVFGWTAYLVTRRRAPAKGRKAIG